MFPFVKCGIVVYNYYKKESRLKIFSSVSSRKKRAVENLNHWFVQYRGFVYEYGDAGYQELDINDPDYKYGPGGVKVVAETLKGTSCCTRNQILEFIEKWLEANPNFHLLANNCQDFAIALLRELKDNCLKRKEAEEKERLKAQCPNN